MRLNLYSVPSSYDYFRSAENDERNPYELVQHYKDTNASYSHAVRTDKDESPKPVGWRYPKPYYLSCNSLSGPMGRVEIRTPVNYWDPVSQSVQVKYARELYTGSFGDAVSKGGVGVDLLPASVNARRKAEVDALLQLKSQKVNLGVALAEARQTADFCGDVFSAIGRSVQLANRKQWRRSFQTLRNQYRSVVKTDKNRLTNDWLGWQYAAKPLIQDVNGAIAALKTRDDLAYWITTVKGVNVLREKDSVNLNNYDWTSSQHARTRFRGYFVRLDYHPGNTFLSSLTSLGVTNPLEVIWEKVPFSFVIDWGVSIGDWLSTMDATYGYEFLSGSCTERMETIVEYKPFTPTLPYGQLWVSSDIKGKARAFHLKREVYSQSPMVMLPTVKNPFSLGHMANGLSLMVGLLSGGIKNYVRR